MGWKEDQTIKFINPYNFVKFPKEVKRSQVASDLDKKRVTGSISCLIRTQTPIFIPDTEPIETSNEVSGHKIFNFFSYDENVPVIPGSSIRGMIRNVFETVTDSCIHRINNDILSFRDPIPGEPGILLRENKMWRLYRATRYCVPIKNCELDKSGEKWKIRLNGQEEEYENGEEIEFQVNKKKVVNWRKKQNENIDNNTIAFSNGKTGFLLLWEEIETKKNHSIFEKQEEKPIASFYNNKIEELKKILQIYYDNNENVKEVSYRNSGYMELLEKNSTKYIPVWYKEINGKFYLSPACIGRWLLNNKLENFLGKKKTGLMPCSSRKELCEACTLFGMVGEKEQRCFKRVTEDRAIGSRLRFSDGILKDNQNEIFVEDGNYIELKPLASPHISAMEFYTKRPECKNGEADIWNYDYLTNYNDLQKNKTDEIKNEKIRIEQDFLNGRKYYWHYYSPISEIEYYRKDKEQDDKDDNKKVNISARLVDKNKEFQFTVYYDQITEEQREKLLWVLCLGDNRIESNYCYKLGHGKPIGLGSVKIIITDIKERRFLKGSYIYESMEIQALKNYIEQANKLLWDKKEEEKQQLMRILDKTYINLTEKNGVKKVISYPIGDDGKDVKNSEASHRWFAGNREIDAASKMKPKIRYTIRDAMENREEQSSEKYEFPKMIETQKQDNKN